MHVSVGVNVAYARAMSNATRFIARVLVIAIAALGQARSSAAAPITWLITGPVSSAFGNLNRVIPLGTPATLNLTFEPTVVNTANYCPPGTGGVFQPNFSGALSVGNFNVPYKGGFVSVESPGCTVGFNGAIQFLVFGQPPDDVPRFAFNEIRMSFPVFDLTGTTLGEILGNPAAAGVAVQGTPGFAVEGSLRFAGPIVVQQPAPVPEPATMFLFGTGALLAARAVRRKRANG